MSETEPQTVESNGKPKRMSARERYHAEHGPDAPPPRQLHRAIVLLVLMLAALAMAWLIAFGGPHLGA